MQVQNPVKIQHTINDAAQRRAALDIRQSFIVQAPAGSGKTELLVQRFLRLLATVQEPEEVVALTFTRKAAHEMRCRIIDALYQVLDNQGQGLHLQTKKLAMAVLQHSERCNWQLLDYPNRLRIMTIDALCSSIIQQIPFDGQTPYHAKLVDYPLPYYQEAIHSWFDTLTMQDQAQQKGIAMLLHYLDNQQTLLEKLLLMLLAKRDQWLPYLLSHRNDTAYFRAYLEASLQQIIEETLQVCYAELVCLPFRSQLMELAKFAAKNLLWEGSDELITYCQSEKNVPSPTVENLLWFRGIVALLLTKKGTWRKVITKKEGFPTQLQEDGKPEKAYFQQQKKAMHVLLKKLHTSDKLHSVLQHIQYLPDGQYAPDQWQVIEALITLLPLLVAHLKCVFSYHHIIDFIELSSLAQASLRQDENPSELALKLDQQIKHLLIDEFQDTSLNQFALLQQLTTSWSHGDGRSLFLVGDPMQSIYRFRQAEVSLFLQVQQQGVGAIMMLPLQLTENFRSTLTIVSWTNSVFSKLFPQADQINLGAIHFHAASCHSRNEAKSIAEITIHTNDHQQLNYILELIKAQQAERSQASLAILVKSRSHLLDLLPALKEAKIAYQAVDIEPLLLHSIVQDLLALTRALMHPCDHIAWLAVLRAPWCGLTLHDLYAVRQKPLNDILLQLLHQSDNTTPLQEGAFKKLSKDGQYRIKQILPVLQHSLQQRQRHNLRAWIYDTWLALGGACAIKNQHDAELANSFFKYLDQHDQDGILADPSAFTEQLQTIYSKTPTTDTPAGVHVMTIHKAKGLEFDTVIIPYLARAMPYDPHELLIWDHLHHQDGDYRILMAPMKQEGSEDSRSPYQYLRHLQQQKHWHEQLRLLYVASTRAKRCLHLLACQPKKEPPKNSLLALLMPLKTQFKKLATESNTTNMDTTTHTLQPGLYRLTTLPTFSQTEHAGLSKQLNQTDTHLLDLNLLEKEQYHSTIGKVIHLYLAQMGLNNRPIWSKQMILDHQKNWEIQLLHFGLQTAQLTNASKIVKDALLNTIHDPKGQWILQTHQDAHNEYPLTTIINQEVTQLVLDRIFIDARYQRRWIIDYKTGTPQLEEHKQQLNRYAQAFHQYEKQAIYLGVYFPHTSAWFEWEF